MAELNSAYDLPLALQPECIAATDASFGEVFNRVLVQPLEIRVRSFLHRKFEEGNTGASSGQNPSADADPGQASNLDPGGVDAYIRQQQLETRSSGGTANEWPGSLDEAAKLAGYPEGLNTKRNGSAKNGSGSAAE